MLYATIRYGTILYIALQLISEPRVAYGGSFSPTHLERLKKKKGDYRNYLVISPGVSVPIILGTMCSFAILRVLGVQGDSYHIYRCVLLFKARSKIGDLRHGLSSCPLGHLCGMRL
jgi:hypothetical protein